jgi:hypothetical protein
MMMEVKEMKAKLGLRCSHWLVSADELGQSDRQSIN